MAIQNALNIIAAGIVVHDGNGVFNGNDFTVTGSTIQGTAASALTISPTAGQVLQLDDANFTVDGGVAVITGSLNVDDISLNGSTIQGTAAAALTIAPTAGQVLQLDDANFTVDGGVAVITGDLTVDDININGSTIQGTAAAALTISPTAGQVLQLDDSNVTVDGGVVAITGDLTVDSLNLNGTTLSSTGAINILPASSSGIATTLSSSGAAVRYQLYNTSNTAGSDSQLQLTTAGSSAGDSRVVFDIAAGQAWSMGLDNDDTDAFVISDNATLGTNNRFKITTAGGLELLPAAGQAITLDGSITVDGSVIQGTAAAALTIAPTAGQVLQLDDANFTVDGGVAVITGDLTVDSLNFNGATIGFGATGAIVLDTSGAYNSPLQPASQSSITAAYPTNVTGDGTVYSITGGTWTDVTDQNADFLNGTFTAPLGGNYSGVLEFSLAGITATHNRINVTCVTSNRTYTLTAFNVGAILLSGADRYYGCLPVPLADMDASDTAHFTVEVAGGASGKVVDINSTTESWVLIC